MPLKAEAPAQTCVHCGVVAPVGDAFCCYGCELAHQLSHSGEGERQRTAAALTVALLLSMIVMMLSLFLYAEDVYEAAREPMYIWLRKAVSWAAAGLATVVVGLLGPPLARRALRALWSKRLTMELLIMMAAGAAWLVSIGSVVVGSTTVYFDSATAALVLVTFGRYIEARARARAGGVVGPLLEPSIQKVRAGHAGQLSLVAPAEITPGMQVEVPPDGVVTVDLRATSTADVSLAVINGESEPVTVHPGDEVPAGAVVLSAALEGVALRDAASSTLAELERLTRSLREARGRVLRIADRLAAWLTPVIAVVATGTFLYWTKAHGVGAGIEAALAVVLVACPCTYGVITPLIAWLSLRKALEHDVCIRDAAVIDALETVRTVAFDKTGTLTEPLSELTAETSAGVSRGTVVQLAAALEAGVPHPIARVLHAQAGGEQAGGEQAAGEQAAGEHTVHDVVIGGRGVCGASAEHGELVLGAPSWLKERGIAVPARFDHHTAVLAARGEVIGAFRVEERVKVEAAAAVRRLAELGVTTVMLSGDRQARVDRVASQVQIEVAAGELRAADKASRIEALDHPALVGDGINDAPAGAASVVSFAVQRAASLNRGTADVLLLSDDLELVPWTLGLARRALQLSRRTLIAATAYNVVFVSLAATGLLRPVWAGVSMLAASVIALAGGLRMAAHPGPRASEPASDLKREPLSKASEVAA